MEQNGNKMKSPISIIRPFLFGPVFSAVLSISHSPATQGRGGLVLFFAFVLFLAPFAPEQVLAEEQDNAMTVHVSGEGRITLRGRDVQLKELATKLRKRGCTSKTTITVEIPADATVNFIQAMTKQLASGGFRRVIFARPKKAIATTQPRPKRRRIR